MSFSRTLPQRFVLSAAVSHVRLETSDFESRVMITRSMGRRTSVSASHTNRRNDSRTRASYRYSAPLGRGYGYRTSVEGGTEDLVDAEFNLNTEFARYGAEMRWHDGGRGWRLQTRGSIATLDRGWFVAREIRDGFAVIDAGGYEDVRVYLENREVGTTDQNGHLLVPGLRPYESNQLRIESQDLPLTVKIENPSIKVSPYYRSGLLASFGIKTGLSATMRLIQEDGTPVPEGARARLMGGEFRFPVGLDGRVYLEELERGSHIEVAGSNLFCSFDLRGLNTLQAYVALGDVVCRADTPDRGGSGPQSAQ